MSANPAARPENVLQAAPEKPATEAEWAAMDFEPWPEGTKCPLPTNADWVELGGVYLVTLRLAWATMHRSKPQLVAMCRTMEDEVATDFIDNLTGTISFFDGCLRLLRDAELRILIAGMASMDGAAP